MENKGCKIAQGIKCTQGSGEKCKVCSSSEGAGHTAPPTLSWVPHHKDEGWADDCPGYYSHVPGLS